MSWHYCTSDGLYGCVKEPAGDCESLAFVCSRCGNLWGRIIIDGTSYRSVSRLCEACGDGRLLTDFALELLAEGHNWDFYPPAVLQREIRLLLKEEKDGQDFEEGNRKTAQ